MQTHVPRELHPQSPSANLTTTFTHIPSKLCSVNIKYKSSVVCEINRHSSSAGNQHLRAHSALCIDREVVGMSARSKDILA